MDHRRSRWFAVLGAASITLAAAVGFWSGLQRELRRPADVAPAEVVVVPVRAAETG